VVVVVVAVVAVAVRLTASAAFAEAPAVPKIDWVGPLRTAQMDKMRCRICGNAEDNRDYQVREMMFGTRESFSYLECAKCGCLQIAVIPSDMSRYYPADYYSLRSFSPPAPRGSRPVREFLRRLRDRYAVLRRGLVGRILCALVPGPDKGLHMIGHVDLPARPRILDLGCGGGRLLLKLRAIGLKDLLGVDPYIERDIRYPNGLTIRKGSIEDTEGTWDLVMFHHALEHMPDQLAALRVAARLLSVCGTCLVRVPLASSFAWEHYRTNWVQLDAPRHLYLHSVASIELTARNAGLRMKRVIHDSSAFQFTGSELYARDIPLGPGESRLHFSRAQVAEFEKRSEELDRQGRGDQAAFYFEKE
jgi:SAM-dependent methyltransferase